MLIKIHYIYKHILSANVAVSRGPDRDNDSLGLQNTCYFIKLRNVQVVPQNIDFEFIEPEIIDADFIELPILSNRQKIENLYCRIAKISKTFIIECLKD